MHKILPIYFHNLPINTTASLSWLEQKRLVITQKVYSTSQALFKLPSALDSSLCAALQGSIHLEEKRMIRIITGGLSLWTTYSLLDSGLARLFVIETLPHGTGPLGYIGISLFGAKAWMGGTSLGSSAGVDCSFCIESSKSFFHVFRDSHFGLSYHSFHQKTMTNTLLYLFLPRVHAALSGSAHLKVLGIVGQFLGGLAGFLTPTLKFRYTQAEISSHFQTDPYYGKLAYRTNTAISPSRIGVIGSLLTGINTGVFSRMWNDPLKVTKGIVLLGMAWIIGTSTYRYLQPAYLHNSTSLSCLEKIKLYMCKWLQTLRQVCSSYMSKTSSGSKIAKSNRITPAIGMITGLILFNTL